MDWLAKDDSRLPLGNGIACGANGSRILDDWGLDFKKAGFVPLLQVSLQLCMKSQLCGPNLDMLYTKWRYNCLTIGKERLFDGRTAHQMKKMDFGYLEPETGYPWYEIRHQSLHTSMFDIVRRKREGKPAIQLKLGVGAVDVDCEMGQINLADGTIVHNDLVVAADGIYSSAIPRITQDNTPPLRPTRTAFRFEITDWKRVVQDDPLIAELYRDEDYGHCIFLVQDKHIFFIASPTDDGDTMFGLLMHPNIKERDDSAKEWNVGVSREELIKLSEDFDPRVRRMFELATKPYLWTILCRDPIKTCVNGRVVAIGDACHPHLPHHGQGSSSAIEDAASLGVFLSSANKTDVPSRLRSWQSFRLPRASTVQLISISFPAPLEQLEEQIRKDIGYDGTLPENVVSHDKSVQTWLFQYDVRKEAKRFLETSSK